MQSPDRLHLSWDQNPSVREALGDKKPGEKCTIELRLQVDAVNPDGADFTIEAAVPEGYEIAKDDDNAAAPGSMPDDATPLGVVVRMQKAKRSSAGPVPQPARVVVPPAI